MKTYKKSIFECADTYQLFIILINTKRNILQLIFLHILNILHKFFSNLKLMTYGRSLQQSNDKMGNN